MLCLAADKDGRILFGGDFTSVKGIPRFRITRVSADGVLDDTFNSGAGANSTVRSLVPLADGTVIAAGNFSVFNGFPQVGIARLARDGTLDPAFTSSVNGVVHRVVVQSDGRVVLGGGFTDVAGQSCNRLARLRADGTLDPSFDIGTGANDVIYSLALQSDQNLIIGGSFTTYGAFAHPGLARIVAADIAPGGVIEFVSSAFSVSEAAPNVTIQVRRSGDTSKSVTVNYGGANGTANAGDYTSPAGKLTFGVGSGSVFRNGAAGRYNPGDGEFFACRKRQPVANRAFAGWRPRGSQLQPFGVGGWCHLYCRRTGGWSDSHRRRI
ncbi:MAG: hypothetical protein EXS36_11930 [Pedosphaera sp.]|nr:hypothetical protein [Pedosphaera sp.]